MKTSKYSWETFVIAVSFIAVWIYFGALVWAGRAEIQLSPWWQLLLLPALVLMLLIFVRRMKRVLETLRGKDDDLPSSHPAANRFKN